jgi:hypothetical protein
MTFKIVPAFLKTSLIVLTSVVLLFSVFNFVSADTATTTFGIIPTQPLSAVDKLLNLLGAGIIPISGANQLDYNRQIIADIFPQLSSQDNVWAIIPPGEYVRATFERELTNKNDITVYAKGQGTIEVYKKDSPIKVMDIKISGEKTYRTLLTNLQGTESVFDLRIIGDIQLDFVTDPLYTNRTVSTTYYFPYFDWYGGVLPGVTTSNYVGFKTGSLTGNCYQIADATYVDSQYGCWNPQPCMILNNYPSVTPGDTFDVFSTLSDCTSSFVPPALTITISTSTNNLSTTSVTVNGNITSLGGGDNANITLYWGTTDGSTTISAWASSSAPTSPAQPQGVATFTKNITGLTPGTKYYFTAKATNSTGDAWSATTSSFTTIPLGCDATGGTFSSANGKCIFTFTSSGTFNLPADVTADVLVVAGGGGGGGGGLIYQTSKIISAGNISVTVGAGGATSANGQNSVFSDLTAVGGGSGTSGATSGVGGNGGSGGGAAKDSSSAGGLGTGGQGNNGGASCCGSNTGSGGGGGAGQVGEAGAGSEYGGNGGNGLAYDISGVSTYYAGGGGGAANNGNAHVGTGGLGGGGTGGYFAVGAPGVANTGGGGGGGHWDGSYAGGVGGSGIVIISYVPASSITTPTITLSAATNVTASTATLNGNITNNGGASTTVTLYWGTTDGGTTTSAWTNSSAPTSPTQPQDVASFLKNISSLTGSTTYYFSALAINSAGTSWPTSSLSFNTGTSLASGLVGEWRMNNNWLDSSGHGNNGTAYGGATFAAGKLGSAAGSFNGVDGYIDIADSDNFYLPNSFAIQFWTKLNAIQNTMFYRQSPDSNNFFQFYFEPSNGLVFYSRSGGVNVLNFLAPWSPTTSTWYHIVLIRDVNTWKVFVNDQPLSLSLQVGSYSSAEPNIASDLIIGSNFGSYEINGLMDETCVWNRALSASDVATLYNGGLGIQCDGVTPSSFILKAGLIIKGMLRIK